jgi:hypothetical protein
MLARLVHEAVRRRRGRGTLMTTSAATKLHRTAFQTSRLLDFCIPAEEVLAIDDWRRAHMPLKPRGTALRWLLRFAVEHSQPKEEIN